MQAAHEKTQYISLNKPGPHYYQVNNCFIYLEIMLKESAPVYRKYIDTLSFIEITLLSNLCEELDIQ